MRESESDHAGRRLITSLKRGPMLPLAALLVAAILVNAAGFSSADRRSPANWRAVRPADSSDFATMVHSAGGLFGKRYAIHFALAELAPGSHVIVPSMGPLSSAAFAAQLHGMGQAAEVSKAPAEAVSRILPQDAAPADLSSGFDPSPFVIAQGDGGDSAPWAIALDAPDPRPADLRDPETFLGSLLFSGRHGEARGPARELLLLMWLPEGGGGPARRLFVETSLLPTDLRPGLMQ